MWINCQPPAQSLCFACVHCTLTVNLKRQQTARMFTPVQWSCCCFALCLNERSSQFNVNDPNWNGFKMFVYQTQGSEPLLKISVLNRNNAVKIDPGANWLQGIDIYLSFEPKPFLEIWNWSRLALSHYCRYKFSPDQY